MAKSRKNRHQSAGALKSASRTIPTSKRKRWSTWTFRHTLDICQEGSQAYIEVYKKANFEVDRAVCLFINSLGRNGA